MFKRRVFYNTAGEVVRCYTMQGKINPNYTAEQEKIDLGLADCDCMEWNEPDPAVEAEFSDMDENGKSRRVEVSVDVSGNEPKLVFSYTPVEETEWDDPYAIIDILTGGEA